MKIHGLTIPQAAIDAARSAIRGEFRLEDVRGSLARALHEAEFDFDIQDKASVLDRAADRILQRAKRDGLARHLGGGRWRATA